MILARCMKVTVFAAIAMTTSVALLVVPLAAAAQTPVPAQTPAQVQARAQEDAAVAALRASMTATAHAAFADAVRDARERELPVQPLIAKAQEGAAKNVGPDRIVAAVLQTRERLGRAQLLLRGDGAAPRPGAPRGAGAARSPDVEPGTARARGVGSAMEISMVADALQRGVPDHAVARLVADAAGQSSVGLSAHALADLTDNGVPLAVGVEVIGAWRGQGADPARLKEIPAAIERLVRQGVVPARAGAAVAAGLRIGRNPGSLTPADVRRILGG